MNNRIWIELDKPSSKAHAEEQCRLANNMLAKLGKKGPQKFFWLPGSGYCYGDDSGYNDLPDNGTWFNLDWLGKD